MKSLLGAAAAAALFAAPSAAFAGTCPAGKEGVDVTPAGPSAPSAVADDVIASIDLSDYQIPDRMLRMRRLVIQPTGVVPWHSHAERPANIYVVSGEVTEYRSTCSVPITHKAGDVIAEQGATSHWWRNNAKKPAVLISADVPPPASKDGGM
jgi:quercetin dioxygenase-like cupin family protein